MASALLLPNTSIQIRPLHPEDLSALLAGCWKERATEAAKATFTHLLSAHAAQRDMGYVVVMRDTQPGIIAFGRLTIWFRYAEISDMIVIPEYQSRGYGTALIQHLIQIASSFNLDYVEIGAALSNPRALALYLRLGFQKWLVRQLDLGHGLEAVQYMRIRLPADG